MGIFSILEERQSPGPLDDFWYEPISRWKDQAEVGPYEALSSTPVWAAVNLISGTIASLPLVLYRELENGGKERAADLPLYDLLRWQPNGFQTAVEMMEMGQGHLCLRGNAFFRLETNRADELIAIVPLHPDKMKLKLLNDSVIEYHYQRNVGTPRVFSSEEILHVKGLSSDGLIGYSPITVAAGAIALSKAAENYGSRFFENSATPSGILSHPGKLKPEARNNIKQSWQAAHGAGKQHSVALLEEGLSWTTLSFSPEESQLLETRKYQAEEIARLFNVPPHLLMLLDRSTFSNVVEANKAFAVNCIRPWAIRWEQAIRKSILERFGDRSLFTEFEMDALLRPDTMARAQANQILLQNGALTIDEWRGRENMNPLDSRAGEVHWMPLNIAPVSVAEAGPSEEDAARQLRNELRSQHVQVDDTFGLRELRSLSNRRKIAEATRPLIEDASQRLLRREVKAVQRMMTKQLSGLPSGRELRGTDGLHNDLEEFYHGEFTEVIAEALLPVIRSYAREIYTQAALEVGFPPEFTPELEEFIRGYVSVSAAQHAQTSRQELQSLISTLDFTELLNALELKLAEWLDTRAQKMAKRQTTEGNGAFSKFTYIIGGVISMRWVTAGAATCPFCRKLNGKVVETFENFINAGETLEVIEEDDTVIGETSKKVRLVPRKNVGHPPAHPGCDCFVSPGL
jgi:HK97 family phage portal protein